MIALKLTQVGNSIGVVLPKEVTYQADDGYYGDIDYGGGYYSDPWSYSGYYGYYGY